MLELLSDAPEKTRSQAGDLIMTTISTVGKEFSEASHSDEEIEAYADARAEMFCAYISRLEGK